MVRRVCALIFYCRLIFSHLIRWCLRPPVQLCLVWLPVISWFVSSVFFHCCAFSNWLHLYPVHNAYCTAVHRWLKCHIVGNTHTRLTAVCPGLPRWAGTRKVKPIWILLKHETVSGSGISWAVCKSAPRSKQMTMPAPHHSVFYRPDALPAAQPTASKHWRQMSHIVRTL